jgi:GxxExxY protein
VKKTKPDKKIRGRIQRARRTMKNPIRKVFEPLPPEVEGAAKQVVFPITYDGLLLDSGLWLDLLVEKCLIVEIKAVENLLSLHEAQLLTYLRLTGLRLGLLINFNVPRLKDGIKRVII